MRYSLLVLLILLCVSAGAQKPFTEGILRYKVKLKSPDNRTYKGYYTFTFKGPHVKKELKLDNGFEDVVLIDCGTGKVYSLQNRNGKKFAIQLSMEEIVKKQDAFLGFTVSDQESDRQEIDGFAVSKGKVSYKDGSSAEIFYSKDWYPLQSITYERFPGAKFLPMSYSYTDEHGISMDFETDKLLLEPVENAVFRIPPEYKMISYEEYKELSK